MKAKVLRNGNDNALHALVYRGLKQMGEDLINQVRCRNHQSVLGPLEYTWHERQNIREALALLHKDRAWALGWLRQGIKHYREREKHETL